MPKQNFKLQAKRKRQLAKLDKRTAKDQKRAARRGDGTEQAAEVAVVAASATPAATPALGKPLTLAEAVERWKKMRIVKPRAR